MVYVRFAQMNDLLFCFSLLLLLLPLVQHSHATLHIQSFVNKSCGISYSYPEWSIDVATNPHLRSRIAQELKEQGVHLLNDYAKFYPNCSGISTEFIQVSALYPLLAQLLPPPITALSKLQQRTLFQDASLPHLLWPNAVRSLLRYGVVVVDHMTPSRTTTTTVAAALKKAQLLHTLQLFLQAKTLAAEHLVPVGHTGSGGVYIPSFRSDVYLWLDKETKEPVGSGSAADAAATTTAAAAIQQLRAFHHALMAQVKHGLNSVRNHQQPLILPHLSSLTAPLLTCYGCVGSVPLPHRYGAHVDSSAFDVESKLSVTSLYYLSSHVEGGALRVGLLNPSKDRIDRTLDVVPKAGRLVLFLSKYIPHSVEWTFSPRYTMTSFLRHD